MCIVNLFLSVHVMNSREQTFFKVPITPKTFFRFVKSLHGIRKNAAKIFAIG